MATQPELPVAAGDLIPHCPPMRMVSRLLSCDQDDVGTVEALVGDDNPLLEEDGTLAEVALCEIIAQAFAATQGYVDLKNDLTADKGFLVGIRKVECLAPARRGDTLQVSIRLLMQMENFYIVSGEIHRDSERLAAGELKVWVPELQTIPSGVTP